MHCTYPTSRTYDGDEWVLVEVLVLGDDLIRHIVDGVTVLEFAKPQIGGGNASPTDPRRFLSRARVLVLEAPAIDSRCQVSGAHVF